MLQHLKTAIKLGGGQKEKNDLLLYLVDNAQSKIDALEQQVRDNAFEHSERDRVARMYDEKCIQLSKNLEYYNGILKSVSRLHFMKPPEGYQSLIVQCLKGERQPVWSFDDESSLALWKISSFGHVHVAFFTDATPSTAIADEINKLNQREGYDWKLIQKVTAKDGSYSYDIVPV